MLQNIFGDCSSIIFYYLFGSCRDCWRTLQVAETLLMEENKCVCAEYTWLCTRIIIGFKRSQSDGNINIRYSEGGACYGGHNQNKSSSLPLEILAATITHNISMHAILRLDFDEFENTKDEFDIHEMMNEIDEEEPEFMVTMKILYDHFDPQMIRIVQQYEEQDEDDYPRDKSDPRDVELYTRSDLAASIFEMPDTSD